MGCRPMSPESFAAAKNRLWGLHYELATGSEATDDAVLVVFDDFARRLQTHCEAAAEGLLAAAAPICRHRPNLVVPLMRRTLRPLVYLGYERAEQVHRFVGWFLEQPS